MPRYTPAYSNLSRSLHEIDAIIAMASATTKRPMTQSNLMRTNALCRGGIVLLYSHLEGYIKGLAQIAISHIAQKEIPKSALSPGLRYYLSRDLIDELRAASDPLVIASKVDAFLARDAHIWDPSPNFSHPLLPELFTGNFSTPRHAEIRRVFRRFGYDVFERDLAGLLGPRFGSCKNMVDDVVEQRNKIAHGDPVTAGTPSGLRDMHDYVKLYCRSTDQVAGGWFKSKGCPIR